MTFLLKRLKEYCDLYTLFSYDPGLKAGIRFEIVNDFKNITYVREFSVVPAR